MSRYEFFVSFSVQKQEAVFGDGEGIRTASNPAISITGILFSFSVTLIL